MQRALATLVILLTPAAFVYLFFDSASTPPAQDSLSVLPCSFQRITVRGVGGGKGARRAYIVCRTGAGEEEVDSGFCHNQARLIAPGAFLRIAWAPAGGLFSSSRKKAWSIEEGSSPICTYHDALAHRANDHWASVGGAVFVGVIFAATSLYRRR